MSEIKSLFRRTATEYGIITISVWTMVVGIYFFKFPNYFAFGDVTSFSTVVSEISRWSASDSASIVNISLLVSGFIFLGRGFGIKTVYTSMVISISLSLLGRVYLLSKPLTIGPLLELPFTILLPVAGTAILFNLGAFSGGTDIVVMILKRYASLNIGTALMLVDVAAATSLFFIFGPETGLFPIIGLVAKSPIIDDVIENLNLCKRFNIICDDPGPICDYIINTLHRSTTVYHAEGVFAHYEKTVIMTTTKRGQALKLRNYTHAIEPTVFMLISNSSEIIGEGFLVG